MLTMKAEDDFYEDDEPIEDVIAAFETGIRFVTAPPPAWTQEFRAAVDGVDPADGASSACAVNRTVRH